MRRVAFAPALACAALLGGCLGTPTPLAPSVTGSVGMPHHGVQTAPVELPVRGDGFVRFRPKSDHYWGNPRLVAVVERAAQNVARAAPGGEPLVIGDLSGRYGGKIPGHRSHRNGRDVDLLFYVTTPSGAPVKSPGFVRFDGDGLASLDDGARYLRLDVEREWLLVKELLSAEELGIQFLFVSRDLEALLIDYARARSEPPELIYHAETVLLQPGDSTPHDDHLHLRIACTPEEAVNGCEGGPLWDWLPASPRLGPLDDATLQRIADDDPLEPEPERTVTADPAPATPTERDSAGGGA